MNAFVLRLMDSPLSGTEWEGAGDTADVNAIPDLHGTRHFHHHHHIAKSTQVH